MEKRFTQAQVDLALRKEQLILRVERGESLETVSHELSLAYHPKHVSRLRRRYREGGRHWIALVDGREGGQATKITREVALWIVGQLQHNLQITAAQLCDELRRVFDLEVSEGRIRQLVRGLGHRGQPGRPRRPSPPAIPAAEPLIIEQTHHAGIFFPACSALADADPARPDAGVGKVQSPIWRARCKA